MSNVNNHSTSNNSKDSTSNPFGEYEDEEQEHTNQSTGFSRPPNQELESDEEAKSVQEQTYLNVRVRALYDYTSAEDDELSFKAGKFTIKLFQGLFKVLITLTWL